MRTVVDASVAVKWYLPELGSDRADALLAEAIEGRRELLAPDLIEAELVNTVWKKTRRGECRGEEAEEILDLWQIDRPRLIESTLLSRRALGLALQLGLSVYDALYLSAAIELEAELATADARLARVSRSTVRGVALIV